MTDVSQAAIGEVETLAYAGAPAELRLEIARLQERAYGASDGSRDAPQSQPLHDPVLNTQAFFMRADGRVISYAGVVTKRIQHGAQTFSMSGLACVATDPDCQRQGLARRVVAAATRHMAHSGVDLGVFTCAPHLAALYGDAGGWPIAPAVVLIGSQAQGALTSSSLGVVVLMRLFSQRAQAASATLLHGTLDLDLPLGQFL